MGCSAFLMDVDASCCTHIQGECMICKTALDMEGCNGRDGCGRGHPAAQFPTLVSLTLWSLSGRVQVTGGGLKRLPHGHGRWLLYTYTRRLYDMQDGFGHGWMQWLRWLWAGSSSSSVSDPCESLLTHFRSYNGPFSRHFGIFHRPKHVTTGSKRAKNTCLIEHPKRFRVTFGKARF